MVQIFPPALPAHVTLPIKLNHFSPGSQALILVSAESRLQSWEPLSAELATPSEEGWVLTHCGDRGSVGMRVSAGARQPYWKI